MESTSVVLIVGVLIVGALIVGYLLYTRKKEPEDKEPTPTTCKSGCRNDQGVCLDECIDEEDKPKDEPKEHTYTFEPLVDYRDSTWIGQGAVDIASLKAACSADSACVGFGTHGNLASKLGTRTTVPQRQQCTTTEIVFDTCRYFSVQVPKWMCKERPPENRTFCVADPIKTGFYLKDK